MKIIIITLFMLVLVLIGCKNSEILEPGDILVKPNQPVRLKIAHLSNSMVRVSFYGMSDIDSGVVLERSENNGAYKRIAIIPQDTSFIDNYLDTTKEYSYRIYSRAKYRNSDTVKSVKIRYEKSLSNIRLYDTLVYRLVKEDPFINYNANILHLCITSDGKYTAFTRSDSCLSVYSLSGKNEVIKLNMIYPTPIVFSNDNNKFICSRLNSDIYNLEIYNTSNWQLIKSFRIDNLITQMELSTNDKYLAIDQYNRIKILDIDNNFNVLFDSLKTVKCMTFSNDSRKFAYALDSYIYIWDIESKKMISKINTFTSNDYGGISKIKFSKDDTKIISACNNIINIYNTNDNSLFKTVNQVNS